jgi:hypothetical protein
MNYEYGFGFYLRSFRGVGDIIIHEGGNCVDTWGVGFV